MKNSTSVNVAIHPGRRPVVRVERASDGGSVWLEFLDEDGDTEVTLFLNAEMHAELVRALTNAKALGEMGWQMEAMARQS
jgi:hypothetical protein